MKQKGFIEWINVIWGDLFLLYFLFVLFYIFIILCFIIIFLFFLVGDNVAIHATVAAIGSTDATVAYIAAFLMSG